MKKSGTLSSGEMLVQHTTTPFRGWEGSKRTLSGSDEGDPARDEDAGGLPILSHWLSCPRIEAKDGTRQKREAMRERA